MPRKTIAAPATSPVLSPAEPPPTAQKVIGGKLGRMVQLLRRPEGADLAELVQASGWRAQSVRGALAGALKARGFEIRSEKADGQPRRWRTPAPQDASIGGER